MMMLLCTHIYEVEYDTGLERRLLFVAWCLDLILVDKILVEITSMKYIALDYTPDELSFDFQYSDTWFSYIWDTSDEAGHVGQAAYYLETRRGTTTTTHLAVVILEILVIIQVVVHLPLMME